MQFPLNMSFKILSISPQISVTDAMDNQVFYVKQKMFRLKEDIIVYSDSTMSKVLFRIKADRIMDWSACYKILGGTGEVIGAVRRKGMKSIWRAEYEVLDQNNTHISTIKEENPMAKMGDMLLGSVPIVSMLSGYLFHPKYLLTSYNGTPGLRMTKKAALFESKFKIDKLAKSEQIDQQRALMSFIMMALLESKRG